MKLLQLEAQTDGKILSGIERLIAGDRKRKAMFVAYLAEAIRRKLYAKLGYGSVFRFLVEGHGLAESSALKRIQAAKLGNRFPFLFEQIALGNYSLSALGRLAPFINNANAEILFHEAKGKSVRQVEEILLSKYPREEVEDRLKKTVSPLGGERVAIQFTADKEFAADLEKVTALLSHRFPQGRMKDVMGFALKSLIQEMEKASARGNRIPRGIQTGPAVAAPTSTVVHLKQGSRHIPRGIQRDVWKRDEARCQYQAPDGKVCGETRFLEMDHIQPWALGGQHQKENLRLLCWTHNQLRSQVTFGKKWRPKLPG